MALAEAGRAHHAEAGVTATILAYLVVSIVLITAYVLSVKRTS